MFQLLQGGWPADLVLRTVATSVNGKRNSQSGVQAEADFERLAQAMTRIQRSGGVSIRVYARPAGSAVVVVRPGESDAQASDDARVIQELLGLTPGLRQFDVVYGLLPSHDGVVAVLSRSMLEIMQQLGFGITLSEAHAAGGRVLPAQGLEGVPQAAPLVKIQSGPSAPDDAYAAAPYRGHWYWIDDTAYAIKRTFTVLMILFSLAETRQGVAAPVVRVPSR